MDLKICAKKTCNRSGFALKISSKSDHFSKIYGTSKSVHFHFDLTVTFLIPRLDSLLDLSENGVGYYNQKFWLYGAGHSSLMHDVLALPDLKTN